MSNPNDRQNPFVHGGKLPIGLFGFAEIRIAVSDTRWSLVETFGKNAASMLLGRTGDIPSEHPLAQGTAGLWVSEVPAEELVCRDGQEFGRVPCSWRSPRCGLGTSRQLDLPDAESLPGHD